MYTVIATSIDNDIYEYEYDTFIAAARYVVRVSRDHFHVIEKHANKFVVYSMDTSEKCELIFA